MRIGVSGGAPTVKATIEQAVSLEEAGFTSLWYAGAVAGDPLVAIALAGRATKTIELGTSVLQTYTCHPMLMANRAASVVTAMDRPGFTLGIGPSHQSAIENAYGLSYDHPGQHTEEYVRVLMALLVDGAADFDGDAFRVHTGGRIPRPSFALPVLLAALGPRLLRVAGELTDGTILWLGNARAIETHVVPRISAAAAGVGRPAPRIVAGLPVAVHDDMDEARRAAAELFSGYGTLPNYRRLLDIGGAAGPEDVAIVGDRASVRNQIQALFDAGATDVWAAPFPVGDDPRVSRRRTMGLLYEIAMED